MKEVAEDTTHWLRLDRQQYRYDNWDAGSTTGCLCDEGYTGFDCSLR